MFQSWQPFRLLLILGVFSSGIPAQAQWGNPPPWWDWLERSQQSEVPYDLNGDGVHDVKFRYAQSFEGTLLDPANCCHALVRISWELQPLGETQFLVAANPAGTRSTPLRVAAGELISVPPDSQQAWSSQSQRLGSYIAKYASSSAPEITESEGPFADSDGFVGVKFQNHDQTAVGWISIPQQLEGILGWPQFSRAHQPTSSYAVFPDLQISAGQMVPAPEPQNPRWLVKDVNGDGIADYVIEEVWSSPIPEMGELRQVSIKGLRGAQISAAPTPEEGNLPRWVFASDGTVSAMDSETMSPAPIADRELLGPKNRSGKHWAETGKWVVLWQKEPGTGRELGPLSEGGTSVLGGKLADQKCGWMRLTSPTGPFEYGGFLDYECVAERETSNFGNRATRVDLNEDGLVDVVLMQFFGGEQCGARAVVETFEPYLIPTGWWWGGLSASNVPPGFMIPADRYLDELFELSLPIGRVDLDVTICETCPGCWFPTVIAEVILGQNFVPVRIKKAGLWHSGWIGFVSWQLQAVINPIPGESTPAGQIPNPAPPIALTVEAVGEELMFHWDSYLMNPQLQSQRMGQTRWTPVSTDATWSHGMKARPPTGRTGTLYRLVY